MKPSKIALALMSVPIATIAIAQQTTPPGTAVPPAASQNSTLPSSASASPSTDQSATSGGLRMADKAVLAIRYATVKPADFMATNLIGIDVYNNQNEQLGTIEDVVVENGRTVSGVVVSSGGFLGFGEHYVVLDPSTVVLSKRDNTFRAFVDTSKDNLKSAPKFTYTKNK